MRRNESDLVAAANQGPARHIQEAHIPSDLLPTIKFCWLHVTVNFHVLFCGAHILAKRNDVNIDFTKFYNLVIEPKLTPQLGAN
jgi:hypothetical protein